MSDAAPPTIERLAANRFLQKKFLNQCGIETVDFRLARNHRELVVAHKALGFPGTLKLQFVDEERSGPWVVRDFDDVPLALRETRGRPLLWERSVAIERAFSLEVERDAAGAVRLSPQIEGEPRAVAVRIGECLGVVGVYFVTFVVAGGRLLVDEIDWT